MWYPKTSAKVREGDGHSGSSCGCHVGGESESEMDGQD